MSAAIKRLALKVAFLIVGLLAYLPALGLPALQLIGGLTK